LRPQLKNEPLAVPVERFLASLGFLGVKISQEGIDKVISAVVK
jgi:hypothetical protein